MKKIIYAAMAFSPVLALAQSPGLQGGASNITGAAKTLADGFKDVVNVLIPAFFGLAIIYFFYGVAKYILAAGDPKKASEGKSIMIYGVIALAVMALLYGIINFIGGTLGISTGSGNFTPPKIN